MKRKREPERNGKKQNTYECDDIDFGITPTPARQMKRLVSRSYRQ